MWVVRSRASRYRPTMVCRGIPRRDGRAGRTPGTSNSSVRRRCGRVWWMTAETSRKPRQASGCTSSVPVSCGRRRWRRTTVDGGDPGANVELGTKFTADVSGSVTGVRFYKSAENTGTHTGSLWNAGKLLATVTFAGESESGWQQATFSSPVPINAGQTYVVSYHTTVGHYSLDANYFDNAVPQRAVARAGERHHQWRQRCVPLRHKRVSQRDLPRQQLLGRPCLRDEALSRTVSARAATCS